MADLVQVAGWTQYSNSLPHLRSLSSSSTSRSPAARNTQTQLRQVSKSTSTPSLNKMAEITMAPGLPPARLTSSYSDEDGNMSTIPDPRSRTMSPANDDPTSPSQHPDLSNEVATLSNKLINAINYQTNLDDTLSATRHELEGSQQRVLQLERENQEHKDLVARGILIKKSVAESEKAKLVASLVEERRVRTEVEKDKKNIEQELETLTTALFEEANKMVSTAREEAQKEHDIILRRNDQLKSQLADTEVLLKSHQEQLAQLKQVMEQMTVERDDQTNPTAPSTPALSRFDPKEVNSQDSNAVQLPHISDPVSPSYPTSFTHLVQPVLRTDLSAYDDFTSLLQMSKNIPANSRASSGSYGNIGLGLGLGAHNNSVVHHAPSNGSTSSISTAFSSSPATPTTPASTVSNGSTNGPHALTPLKETKFYKRVLAEDIEPTLRLDVAPGLSWLARRTVLNAVCEGALIVEPMPASTKQYTFACSLCGETRKDPAHVRSHRFRTNESENAQRYPLCKYCLGRVRSTCDFLGFLRILKDGHWRADDEESERAAWEESVRLREQMFWCRMGGGVIPAHHAHSDVSRSPRISEGDRKEQQRKMSEEMERTGNLQPKDITPVPDPAPLDGTRHSKALDDTSTTLNGDDTNKGLVQAAQVDTVTPTPTPQASNDCGSTADDLDDTKSSGKHGAARDSVQSTSSLMTEGGQGVPQRLSITIPGSSES